ncbi:hypothetical protein acdb102_49590 [Acidothermaceae bacterium B102]|nr:hypothetical protein acdb102_49590 [Acidothermaceae bacterium B102]
MASGLTAAGAVRLPRLGATRALRAVAVVGLTAVVAACTPGTAPHSAPRAPATASSTTVRTVVTGAISQSLLVADDQPDDQAPAFFEGSRLLGAVPIGGGTGSRSIWFTPTSTELSLEAFGGCNSETDTSPALSFRVLINDRIAMTNRCTADNNDTTGPAATAWSDGPTNVWSSSLGVRVGRRAKLTVQYLHPTGHAVGTFAVYQQVAPAQYQFAPQPAHLALPPSGSQGVLLDARRLGANGTFTLVARVGEQLRLTTAAPGQLTIGCGVHQLFGVSSWYYKPYDLHVDVTPSGLGEVCPASGQPSVRLTVVASRFVSPGWIITES